MNNERVLKILITVAAIAIAILVGLGLPNALLVGAVVALLA